MSAGEWATGFLLAFAILICVISGIGITVMPGFYDKLHYLAPPAVLSLSAVVAALLLKEGFSGAGIKAVFVLLVMVVSNPVLTHAAARANRVRGTRQEKEDG